MTASDSGVGHADATVMVVLDYCGGARTDALVETLKAWNPGETIFVLDNASPHGRARSATHRNAENSYVGGGIRDCLNLAEKNGARYLFYCVNDVDFLDPLRLASFQAAMDADPDCVLCACALSPDSDQARHFPWMARRAEGGMRRVRFADLICCAIRLDFVRSFGGFPPSKGGWGYAAELAYHVRERGKTILVNDDCAIRNVGTATHMTTAAGETISKEAEARAIYAKRYGSLKVLRSLLSDAAAAIPPSSLGEGDR